LNVAGEMMQNSREIDLSLMYEIGFGPSAFDDLFGVIESLEREARRNFLSRYGLYPVQIDYSLEDLDTLNEAIGPLCPELVGFGESLFDHDIANFALPQIAKKLAHPLLAGIREIVRFRVLNRLIEDYPPFTRIEPSWLEGIVAARISSSAPLDRHQYRGMLKREVEKADCPVLLQGKVLAEKLADQYKQLNEKYGSALVHIEFEDSEVDLLKRMAVSSYTGAVRDYDEQSFTEVLGKGGVAFFSCLAFSKTQDKESNTNFWKWYIDWLGFSEDESKSLADISKDITQPIKKFSKQNNIYLLYSDAGRTEYVQSFRMHSIVANRPMSKHRIAQFLLRTIKNEGVLIHDKDEQWEILSISLFDLTEPLANRAFNNDYKYHQLPLETAYAFMKSQIQVVDFLLPIYNYMESALVEIINEGDTGLTFDTSEVPAYLLQAAQEYLATPSYEEIRKLRSLSKFRLRGRPVQRLRLDDYHIEIVIPTTVFTGLKPNASLELSVVDEADSPIFRDILEYETHGDTSYTDEIVVSCEFFYDSAKYQFVYDGVPINSGSVLISHVFDNQGLPLIAPIKSPQSIYCIANRGAILADGIKELKANVIGDYSLYKAYLGSDYPVLIGDQLYVVESGPTSKDAGILTKHDRYQYATALIEGKEYPIIGELPILFLNLPSSTNVSDEIQISINGRGVAFAIISENHVEPANSFMHLQIREHEQLQNGSLVTLRIFRKGFGGDLFYQSFFIIKNLHYAFSKILFLGEKEVEIEELECDDKDQIFQGRYKQLPLSQFKFRMDRENGSILILQPPVIKAKYNGQSLFGGKRWFDDFQKEGTLHIEVPEYLDVISVATYDSKNCMTHKLTQAKKNEYRVSCLLQEPDTDEPYVTLALDVNDEQQGRKRIPVCQIYYKIEKKEDHQIVFYREKDIKLAGTWPRNGLNIKMGFYCSAKRKYLLSISSKSDPCIITGELSVNGEFIYNQEKDLPSDIYSITITEVTQNPFNAQNRKKCVYDETFSYQQENDFQSEKNKIPYNGFKQKDKSFHKFQILQALRIPTNAYAKAIGYTVLKEIPNFHIQGSCRLTNGEVFEAKGFFVHGGNKEQEIYWSNPMKVEIVRVNQDGKLIFEIFDKDGYPLSVGTRNGHINKSGNEECFDCSIFLGRLVF
jgi:hypothetical protein